jgi:hypothetical protein
MMIAASRRAAAAPAHAHAERASERRSSIEHRSQRACIAQ